MMDFQRWVTLALLGDLLVIISLTAYYHGI